MSRTPAHRASRAITLVVVAGLCLLMACSRNGAIGAEDDAAATSTVTSPTTTSSTSTVPTDPSAPAEDPAATSTTESTPDDGGAFGHTEAELASFRAAYSAAFEAECRRIWSSYAGADGLMADPDFAEDTYSVQDCIDELDPDYGEFADSIPEAQSSGVDDAQIAASDLADPLCATGGSPCWSYGDS